MSGRGHIVRRGANSWRIKFDIGTDPNTGKCLTRYHTVRGTRRQAQAELTKLLSSTDTGTYVDPSKITVGEFLERWERDWASVNVGPTTLHRYGQLIRLNLIPHLGAMPIHKLRSIHLNTLYAKLLREGRSNKTNNPGLAPRTVGHVHRVFHRALNHALTWGIVQQNVAERVTPPRVEETEIEILRQDEVAALLEKLKGKSIYMIAVVGLATGMRRGEMLALRWRDIDLGAGKIRIERSLEQTKVGGLRFKAPKTKRGKRTISIPSSLVTELRAHRKAQQENWLRLGQGKVRDDTLVFATWYAEPRTPNALTKDWSETMAKLGLKATLHSLRHTHASALIAAGMDVVTISRRLGHASPVITLSTYAHLFHSGDDRAAEIMETALTRSRTE